MASCSCFSSRLLLFTACSFIILCSFSSVNGYSPLIFTVVNNCPFTIWPAIQPNSGHDVLERGGFALNSLTHRSFSVPDRPWSGRIWARTGCSSRRGRFACSTGDCGRGLECAGAGGASPTSLAQFSVHHPNSDLSSYAVSLVDGFNLPMTVTPHEGKGVCPVVGCKVNLLETCPAPLQLRSQAGYGSVIACKSGCEAFGTDELCCRNQFNNAATCKPSTHSQFFKQACPATYTYAHDSPSLTHSCTSPKELKVIFCH